MPISTHARQGNGRVYQLNILNDNLFRLPGDPIEGNPPGKTPTLSLSVDDNKLKFNIFLNNGKAAKEGGMIAFDLDLYTAQMFIVAVEDAARRKQQGNVAIAIKKTAWDRQNNRPGEPYVEAVLVVGKDQDNLEFIGVQPRKGPRLQFRFQGINDRPVIDVTNNQTVDPHVVSTLACRGFANFLKFIVPYLAVGTWDYNRTNEGKWEAKRAQQNGQGGNNGNNNGGWKQNNNYQQQPQQQAPAQPTYTPDSQPTAEQTQQAFNDSFEDVPF